MKLIRELTAMVLMAALAMAQQSQISIVPVKSTANILVRPYLAPSVPEIRPGNNSERIRKLVRAGAIYLTAQDAIALAIENNIDLEAARYKALLSDWRLIRSQAAGA